MYEHHTEENFPKKSNNNLGLSLALQRFPHDSSNGKLISTEMLILASGDILTVERLKHAGYICSNDFADICCQANKEISGWSLKQLSQKIVCAVNDHALSYGHSVIVRNGDRIELGLLRLIFVADEVSHCKSTDMLTESDDGVQVQTAMDISLTDTMTDTLTDTLTPFADLPPIQPLRHSNASFSYLENAQEQDVIAELAEQYLMAISAPAGGEIKQTPSIHLLNSSVKKNIAQAPEQIIPGHYSLEDVLSGQLSIEEVFTRIGADNPQWDMPEAIEDVLMLFADGITHRTTSCLPGLTRREHHTISPDSHVAFGCAIDDAALSPCNGNSLSKNGSTSSS